jgi:hypothetical protein
MIRILFALVPMVVACDWTSPDTGGPHTNFPDASCNIQIGEFQIAAPRAGQHYDKSLDVIVDESELRYSFTVQIADDQGNSFAPISDTAVPYPPDAGSWWSLDTFHFELAADTRYTATVSVCTQRSQSVEFFTSP